MNTSLLEKTVSFVKETLQTAEAGHDWFHIERVWKNAKLLLETEEANREVVELAALLHDIADSKFHGGNEELGPRIARRFLTQQQVSDETIQHVANIIQYMSYKASLGSVSFRSKELEIVQDADRLDAIGAIGIARAFQYGGYKNRTIYDPTIPPAINQSKEEYKNSTAPTINHFYEKLLLLKDLMNTPTARRIAEDRHLFMLSFLEEFYHEWEGKK